MGEVIKTRVSEIWLGEDGVLRIAYLSEGVELVLEDAIEGEAALIEASVGKIVPVLGDIRNIKSANRAYLRYSGRPELVGMVSALAVLVGGPVTRMLGNLFIKVDRPPYPTRLFTSEVDALEWLRSFVESASG